MVQITKAHLQCCVIFPDSSESASEKKKRQILILQTCAAEKLTEQSIGFMRLGYALWQKKIV